MWFLKKKKAEQFSYEESYSPPQDKHDVNVVQETYNLLKQNGYDIEIIDRNLRFKDCDLILYPELIEIVPIPDGKGIRTVSVVKAQQQTFFPDGLFEYQHGQGANVKESVLFGLSQWVQLDVPVLHDASLLENTKCMKWDVAFPAEEGQAEKTRHVFLGPTAHFAENRIILKVQDSLDEEHHDFCPCCILTNCIEAFQPLFKDDETFGVRLYAARDSDGIVSADCRINGVDFEEGKKALLAYAQTWPDQGFEFRKQYVLFRNALRVN